MIEDLWGWAADNDFAWIATIDGRRCRVISRSSLARDRSFVDAIQAWDDDAPRDVESMPMVLCTPSIDSTMTRVDLSEPSDESPLARFAAALYHVAHEAGQGSDCEYWSSHNHSELSDDDSRDKISQAWAAAHQKRHQYPPWMSAKERFRSEFVSLLEDDKYDVMENRDDLYYDAWRHAHADEDIEYAKGIVELLGGDADAVEDDLRFAFIEGAGYADKSHPADLIPGSLRFVWVPYNAEFPLDVEAIIENPNIQKNTDFLRALDALNCSGEDFYMGLLSWLSKMRENPLLANPGMRESLERWRPAVFRHEKPRPEEPPLIPMDILFKEANDTCRYEWSPMIAIEIDPLQFLSVEVGDEIEIDGPVIGSMDWGNGGGSADTSDITIKMKFNPQDWGIDKSSGYRSLDNILGFHSSAFRADFTNLSRKERDQQYFDAMCEGLRNITRKDDRNWHLPDFPWLSPPREMAENFIEQQGLSFPKEKATLLRQLAEEAYARCPDLSPEDEDVPQVDVAPSV